MVEPSILHINTARTWRGGERQVLNLALELAELGIEQVIVAQPDSELARRALGEGLPVETVAMRGELDFFCVGKVADIARGYGSTIVHVHTSKAHTVGLRVKKKLPALKLIVSRRVDFSSGGNFFSRRKYLSPLVDRYIAISENVRQVLIADGINPDIIRIAYSGIQPQRYAEVPEPDYLRKEFNLGPDDIVLINVAALVDHKDQHTLLRAAARIQSENWRLFILGAGELRDELEQAARSLGLTRVVFTGFREDILPFYRLADIFVMSSKEEGLGTAVLDGMAFGLPVAATAGGGIPEMIDHGQGGFLVPVGDDASLADGMEQLIQSSSLREKAGAYNKERSKKFTSAETAKDTLTVYREFNQ